MRKAFKYRIYLTKGQRRLLEQQLEACKWVYNETLAVRKHTYELTGQSLSWHETKAMLPAWKEAHSWLKVAHSQVLQNVTERVHLAFQSYFRRVREGAEEPGYPRFKGKGHYDSITYPQYGNGVQVRGDTLLLSKIGAVHMVLHRPIEGTPKTVTLSRSRTGKWFVCFSCDAVQPRTLEPNNSAIGIDMGLESFATFSNEQKIANPRFYRRDEADLKRVQQRKDVAKNVKNWTENAKQKAILAKIHERIANRRSDFAHQLSRAVVNHFDTIVFEELAPLEMGKSRGMRKSIRDVAWSQFIQMTICKAEEAGSSIILVDPRNTSKMCSQCGTLVQKSLSDRVHDCPECGLVMNRDVNAAINILHRGLQLRTS
jgi:putative transposase